MFFGLFPALIAFLAPLVHADPAQMWPGPCVETRYWGQAATTPSLVFRYQYDGDGNLVRRNGKWADGRQVTTRFLYADGFLVTEEDSDGGWRRYHRDDDGHLWGVQSGERQFGEQFVYKWTRFHDSGGVKWVDVDLDGDELPDRQIRQTWEGGRMVDRAVYEGDQLISRTRSSYDEDGRKTSSTTTEGGVTTTWLYSYDAAGNLLERESAKSLVTYDYGCWVGQ